MKTYPLNEGRAKLLFDDTPACYDPIFAPSGRPRLTRTKREYLDLWATLLNLQGELTFEDILLIINACSLKYPALERLFCERVGW